MTLMQIEIQPQPNAIDRWLELCADPELARWPGKIETDRFGRIILMSPPPSLPHGSHQFHIGQLLAQLLPAGEVVTECPLLTSDGVKGIDVAWLAPDRNELAQGDLVLKRAPEICVEVLSPSNTCAEMTEKRALYFEAGAREVWFCGLDGTLEFYTPELSAASRLCPQFPDHDGRGQG
jgi:Uma2 family endonuclease